MKSFNNIREVLSRLHEKRVDYAVLRNYDHLLDDEIYMDGHGDVDLICVDSFALAEILEAYPHEFHMRNGQPDGVHYYIYIKEKKVSLDVRYIGDGYYCAKWEKDMLERKVLTNGFYVLGSEDYFYSLVYHAIFQKTTFSDEYRHRLYKMGNELGLALKDDSINHFVNLLENFMKRNGYHYEYPVDKYVPLKTRHIQDRALLVVDYFNWIKHIVYDTKIAVIELLVSVKKAILRKRK